MKKLLFAVFLNIGFVVCAANREERIQQLCTAAATNDITTVRDLIRSGISVNVSCKDGRTPLFLAALFGHKGAVDVLIDDWGANVYAVDNKDATILHAAVAGIVLDTSTEQRVDRIAIIQKLIDKKITIDATMNEEYWSATPLLIAANFCSPIITDLLVRAGANPLKTNSQGQDSFDRAYAACGQVGELFAAMQYFLAQEVPKK